MISPCCDRSTPKPIGAEGRELGVSSATAAAAPCDPQTEREMERVILMKSHGTYTVKSRARLSMMAQTAAGGPWCLCLYMEGRISERSNFESTREVILAPRGAGGENGEEGTGRREGGEGKVGEKKKRRKSGDPFSQCPARLGFSVRFWALEMPVQLK